jgi:hypothetical protein
VSYGTRPEAGSVRLSPHVSMPVSRLPSFSSHSSAPTDPTSGQLDAPGGIDRNPEHRSPGAGPMIPLTALSDPRYPVSTSAPPIDAGQALATIEAAANKVWEALKSVGANEFTDGKRGWAANGLNAVVARFPSVFISTYVREAVGTAATFALEGQPDEVKGGIAATLIFSACLSNVFALGRQWQRGEATAAAKSATAFNLIALAVLTSALFAKDKFAGVAPTMTKALAYAAARSIFDNAVKLQSSEAKPGPLLAKIVDTARYGANQAGVNEGQSRLALGASVSVTENPLPKTAAKLAIYSAINAFGEVVEALTQRASNTVFAGTPSWGAWLNESRWLEENGKRLSDLRIQARLPNFPTIDIDDVVNNVFGDLTGRWTAQSVLYLLQANINHLTPSGTPSPILDPDTANVVSALVFSILVNINDLRRSNAGNAIEGGTGNNDDIELGTR